MAKECFCGCGRSIPRFPLGTRSINTRGAQVADRLAWAEENGVRSAEGADAWFEEGAEIVATLAGAVHGEIDARTIDEGWVREWQSFGREAQRRTTAGMADLGRAVRTSGLNEADAAQALAKAMGEGMSADEAIAALGRGELRPG